MTEICKYCGKKWTNLGRHEPFCKSRPSEPTKPLTVQEIKDTGLIPHNEKIKEIKRPSFLSRFFSFNSKPKEQKEKKVVTMDEMIANLPRWTIRKRKPWFVSEDDKRKLIQFVGVSRLKPPVMAWVFWDGVFVSVGDRLYQPPHDIRGNVFFYDLDNSKPLLDNIQRDEETHESLRMAQVKNIAYAMGRIAGAQDLLKNLGLILIGIGFIILLGIANAYFGYQVSQGFAVTNAQIGNITNMLNNNAVNVLP